MYRPIRRNLPVLLTLFGLLGVVVARGDVTLCDQDPPPAHLAAPTSEFFVAAATGDLGQLRQSLEEGVAVDATVSVAQAPPETEFPPHSRVTRLLSDPGATALMFAVAGGHVEAINLLLEAKANREARTRSDIRPLDIAAERGDTDTMQLLLGVTPASVAAHLAILVNLSTQKAVLSRDGETVLVTRVSSGKKEKPTPPGRYVVTQKYTEWHSSLYHNASMPFFMRLSCSPVGLHAGVIEDHPASHGCVRLPAEIARKFYEIVPRGTLVTIE